MDQMLYVLGGLLMWLGGYSYTKVQRALAKERTAGGRQRRLKSVPSLLGSFAVVAFIPYLLGMAIAFEWWAPVPFVIFGGLLVGAVRRVWRNGGPKLVRYGIP